tara:strand:- start:349 stop:507 length:159 start_codon:yes stop_codon:yes gene_type:complete
MFLLPRRLGAPRLKVGWLFIWNELVCYLEEQGSPISIFVENLLSVFFGTTFF